MTKKQNTIGVIGLGNFGLLLSAILSKTHKVKVYNYSKDLKIKSKAARIGVELVNWPEIHNCDVVVVSTPISVVRPIIKRVAPGLKKGALLLDVCSVKEYPCRWLKKYAPRNIEIMGTHPMFGPTTTKFNPDKEYWEIEGKQIVLCPLRINKERKKRIEKFLKDLGLEVIITTPQDHDKQNAQTLSFVHFLGRSLGETGIGEQKIYTPGYSDVLKILPHTNRDNWQLFYDMHNFNPYARQIRRKFVRACLKTEKRIIRSDSSGGMDFYRRMIGELDEFIFALLEKRMKYAEKIGKIKKEGGFQIVDEKREKKLISQAIKKRTKKLSPDFVKNFYKLLFKESYKKQK